MERIWWDNIPNAARYVRGISDAVHEEKSMVLVLPPETPWRTALAQIVEEKLADIPDRSLRRISSPEGAPGEYLLRRYCKKERQLAYRGTTSHAEFLAKEEESVLHTAILWLEIERPEEALAWVDFISAYQGFAHKEAPRPSFILVLSEECDKWDCCTKVNLSLCNSPSFRIGADRRNNGNENLHLYRNRVHESGRLQYSP